MDPLTQFLELAGWPRNVEEIGRERFLALLRFRSQSQEGFRAAIFGELKSLLGSSGAGEWEEEDWMEVAEAMCSATKDERASLVEVMEERLGSSRPDMLERVLSVFQADDPCVELQRKTSIMTSGINTAKGTMAITETRKKRKLDLEADEDTAPEGPHKALMLEATLDKILSFLDHRTQRKARLVCQQWNNRILANFHKTKNLELKLRAPGKHKDNDIKILSSVDERMLSSIKIHSCDKRRVTNVFNYLRSSGKLGRLRVLTVWEMDEQALDVFIQFVNEGGFRCLEKLTLQVQFNSRRNRRKRYKCVNSVTADTLPCLKYLKIDAFVMAKQETRFRREHLPVALQSFASAAPKLENISSTVYLNLSGREVKTIFIEHDSLFRGREVFQMCNSVKYSLVNLDLGNCSSAQLPFLPSLETFAFWDNKNIPRKSIDFNAAPFLRRLELPFKYLSTFKFFPPMENLREIEMNWIPAPRTDVLPTLVEPFNLLLNANVDRLVLRFCGITIPQLLRLLQVVSVEERVAEERRKSSVVQFTFQPGLDGEVDDEFYEDEDSKSEYYLATCSAILEKLGGNWGQVWLEDFDFTNDPPPP